MGRRRGAFSVLCVAVLGLVAFNAAAAHAEVGAEWLLAKAWPESSLVPFLEASLGLESSTNLVLHTKVLGIAVLFECTWIEVEIARLLGNGSIGGLNGLAKEAEFSLFPCSTYLNGKLASMCVPTTKTGVGQIRTKPVHGLLELHVLASGTRDDVVNVSPDVGETVAVIEMGKECPIGEKLPLIGKLTVQDAENLALTHLEKHLIGVGPLTELWVISKTPEHAATLLGKAWAYLSGAHTGLKFSGDPA